MVLEATLGLVGLVATSSIGFAFKTSNRVTKVETKIEDLPELISTKLDVVSTQLGFVNQRLERIERAMNGALKEH